jgi:hypothetical protein
MPGSVLGKSMVAPSFGPGGPGGLQFPDVVQFPSPVAPVHKRSSARAGAATASASIDAEPSSERFMVGLPKTLTQKTCRQ